LTIFALALGACFGAMGRFAIGQWVKRWTTSSFPWATLFVNVTGSFALGYVYGHVTDEAWYLFLGIGFLGSFTTFSTFKLELMRYVTKDWIRFGVYIIASYALGIIAAYIGLHS